MTIPSKVWRPNALHGNVVLNFRGCAVSKFGSFAGAYHEAARHLADRLEGAGYSDLDACPIVFLYRHSLELYLKAVIHVGRELATLGGESFEFDQHVLGKHKLTPLADPVFKVFGMAGWGQHLGVSGFQTLDELRGFLTGLDEIDDSSFAFRYPVDKKLNEILPHHFLFNVLDLARRFDTLLELLDGAVTGLSELVSNGHDAIQE